MKLDELIEYLKYEPYIQEKLKQTYDEAGMILAESQKTINDVENLNIANSDILRLFKQNIANNLTPSNFIDDVNGQRYNQTLDTQTVEFKKGDRWIRHNGNRYTAIMNYYQVDYGEISNSEKLESTKGWALTISTEKILPADQQYFFAYPASSCKIYAREYLSILRKLPSTPMLPMSLLTSTFLRLSFLKLLLSRRVLAIFIPISFSVSVLASFMNT